VAADIAGAAGDKNFHGDGLTCCVVASLSVGGAAQPQRATISFGRYAQQRQKLQVTQYHRCLTLAGSRYATGIVSGR